MSDPHDATQHFSLAESVRCPVCNPRQPSTRTAEPRTAAESLAYGLSFTNDPIEVPGVEWVIERLAEDGYVIAEAAAPAGLDVDVLRQAMERAGFGPTGPGVLDEVATEYARLLQGKRDE